MIELPGLIVLDFLDWIKKEGSYNQTFNFGDISYAKKNELQYLAGKYIDSKYSKKKIFQSFLKSKECENWIDKNISDWDVKHNDFSDEFIAYSRNYRGYLDMKDITPGTLAENTIVYCQEKSVIMALIAFQKRAILALFR